MQELTRRQQEVLEIIIRFIRQHEYPPTLKELSDALGASSRNTAVKYLTVLAKKGYIEWQRNKARGLRIIESRGLMDNAAEKSLPLIGAVTAGTPMLAEENVERYVPVPGYLVKSRSDHFLLRVQGESMNHAGILNDDLVVVHSQSRANAGDIIVALINGDATVKRLSMHNSQFYLKAENPEFPDIYPQEEWTIQGKVVALLRESVQ